MSECGHGERHDKPQIHDIIYENFRVGTYVPWEKDYLINSVYTIGCLEETALDPQVVLYKNEYQFI